MMIVDDEGVAAALGYLGDVETAAEVRFNATTAENTVKRIYAELFISLAGTMAERDARVTISPSYQHAKAKEAEAEREFERHKAQVRNAEMVVEIWRTENANARAAERIR